MEIIFIGLILSMIYMWFALTNPRMALNFTLSISLLWPSYIAYKVDPFPGLSPDRAFIFILFLTFLVYLLLKNNAKFILGQYSKIIVLISVYFSWQLLCSFFVSTDLARSVFGILNDFFCGAFFAFFAFLFVTNNKQLDKVVKALFVSFFIINLIGLVELSKGTPLFAKYLISVTDFNRVIEGNSRYGSYRIMSVFSNALVYSQFLVFSVPMSMSFIRFHNGNFLKLMARINLNLTYILIYFTGSRAGLALAIAMPVILLYINLYKNNKYKLAKNIFNYFLIPIFIFGMGYYLYTLLSQEIRISTDFSKMDETEGSTLYRLFQLQQGGIAIMNSPVFGYSFGGELTALHDVKVIDNNYLSIALSSGLVGLSIYIFINLYVLNKGIKAIKTMKDEVMVYFLTAYILLLLYYLILSITKMNLIYYIMVAIIMIRYNELENQTIKAL